jgi:ribonuclease HII
MADYSLENGLIKKGHGSVAGVDEAGRGPLAGPVVAASVILNPDDMPDGIDDSKALSSKKRERLYPEILKRARAVGIGTCSADEIDTLNIRQATHEAMRRAVATMGMAPSFLLVDGNDKPAGLPCEAETIVKGDSKSLSIAAASIIAKVHRDALMKELDKKHPGYGFAKHAGYGTEDHMKALAELGPCLEHRRSFRPVREAIAGAPIQAKQGTFEFGDAK